MPSKQPPPVRLVTETLILYGSIAVRLGASIVFTILLARFLSVEEFAMYGVVAALALILSQPVQLWSFWASRRAVWDWGRGESGPGKTGLTVTLAYAIVAFPVYASISALESRILGWDFDLLLAGYPYVALNSLVVYTRDLSSTVKPQGYAFSRIMFDALRLTLAIPLVAMKGYGYLGALAATYAALAVSQAYMVYYLGSLGSFHGRLDKRLAIQWIRQWRVPVLQVLGDLLRHAPRPYISLLTGNSLAVAYLNVGVSGQSAMLQTAQMTQPALYARILRGIRPGMDVEVSLGLYSVFGGMLLGLFVFLAKPLASLFNPEYIGAYWAIQLVALYSFILGAANIFRSVLVALDKTDKEAAREGGLMMRTMLLHVATTLGGYIAAAPLVRALRDDPGASVAAFLTILSLTALILLAVYANTTRRIINVRYPYRSFAAAASGLALMYAVLRLSGSMDIVVEDVWRDGAGLAANAAAGVLVYIVAVVVVDPMVRSRVSRLLRGRSSRQPV